MIRGLIIALVAAFALNAQAQPRRVVSLDECADEVVLALADRAQLVAVSPFADGDFAYLAEQAKGLPVARSVEEAAALKPDLIVRSWGGARAIPLYQRLAIPVLQLDFAEDGEGAARNYEKVGAALGQSPRAAVIAQRLRTELAPQPRTRGAALYATPSGAAAGTGVFADALLAAAGFDNEGARRGLKGWGHISLEELVRQPPKIYVAAFFDARAETVSRWSGARQPALQKIMKHARTIHLPARTVACGGLGWLEAVRLLRAGAP